METTAGLAIGHHMHILRCQIAGGSGGFGIGRNPDHPDPFDPGQIGRGAKHGFAVAMPGVVGREIRGIILDKPVNGLLNRRLTTLQNFTGQQQRVVFGADHMVRRGHTATAEAGKVITLKKSLHIGTAAQVHHRHRAIGVTGEISIARADNATQHRQDGSGPGLHFPGAARGPGGHLAADFLQPGLHFVGLGYQAVIALPGTVTKGEMAVVDQDQPLDTRVGIMDFRRHLGQFKAGHDEGHTDKTIAENLFHYIFRIGQVSQRQHGGSVGVVYIFMGQKCV